MPKSKKRVKKVKTRNINIRTRYRNDARRMMVELYKGKDLLASNKQAYDTMSYVVNESDRKVTDRAFEKLIEKVNTIIIEADKQATPLRDSTLLEGLTVRQWEEQFGAAAMSTSLHLENQVNEVANYVEASLLLMNGIVGGGGVNFQQLGFDVTELFSKEEIEEMDLVKAEQDNFLRAIGGDPDESLESVIERGLNELTAAEKARGITVVSDAERGNIPSVQAVDESPYQPE